MTDLEEEIDRLFGNTRKPYRKSFERKDYDVVSARDLPNNEDREYVSALVDFLRKDLQRGNPVTVDIITSNPDFIFLRASGFRGSISLKSLAAIKAVEHPVRGFDAVVDTGITQPDRAGGLCVDVKIKRSSGYEPDYVSAIVPSRSRSRYRDVSPSRSRRSIRVSPTPAPRRSLGRARRADYSYSEDSSSSEDNRNFLQKGFDMIFE